MAEYRRGEMKTGSTSLKRRLLFDLPRLMLSLLLSLSYLIAFSSHAYDGDGLFSNRPLWSKGLFIAIAGLLYIGVGVLILLCTNNRDEGLPQTTDNPRWFRLHRVTIGLIVILICWLPWILVNYPGSFCNDAIWQLQQFFGITPMTTHHPPLSTFLMGSCVWVGTKLGSANFGAFLYVVLHATLGAFVFSLLMDEVVNLGTGIRGWVLGIAFFAACPVWGSFAQWFEKDLLFAECMALNLVFMSKVVRKPSVVRPDLLGLIASGIVACLLRNNGIYALMPALILLGIVLREKRRLLLAATSIVFLAYVVVTKGLYPALGIRQGSVGEMLSIPFQQTARFVRAYEGEVSNEEKAAIDAVLDYGRIGNVYYPTIADPVKDTYRNDASKLPAYLQAWAAMGLRHPGVYFWAFMGLAHGYVAPVAAEVGPLVQYEYAPELTDLGLENAGNTGLARRFERYMYWSGEAPVLKLLWMPGAFAWAVVICSFIVLRRRFYGADPRLVCGAPVLFVPALITIAVCVAAPLAVSSRYMLPVMASMPLLVAWMRYALTVRPAQS